MADRDESSLDEPNIQRIPGMPPQGDLIFVSVDRIGSPGRLNSSVLEQLQLDSSFLPGKKELLPGYAIKQVREQQVCFVVTIGTEKTADLLAANLRRALSDTRLMESEHIWIPLMGTGDGLLPRELSERIITDALRETDWCKSPHVQITLALPSSRAATLTSPPKSKLAAKITPPPTRAPPPAPTPPPGRTPPSVPTPPIEYTSPPTSTASSTQPSPDNLNLLPPSEAVSQALAFAAALNQGRAAPRSQVTTSLLFFALAESQVAQAPHALTTDPGAVLFSGAVHYTAGDGYRAGWNSYFSTGFKATIRDKPDRNIGQSHNVQTILLSANERARSRQQDSIGIDDVVVSLLEFADGRYRDILKAMSLTAAALLEAYGTAMTAKIATKLHNDVAAVDDRLGYKTYAVAITEFIKDAQTPAPLSISVQAPWGAGKSSLMQQIRNMLDDPDKRHENKPQLKDSIATVARLTLGDALDYLNRKRAEYKPQTPAERAYWTVWFNAWKYDTTEQVWSGLVDSIVSQVSDRLPPIEREVFLFRLQLARIDDGVVRRKIYERIATLWWNKVRNGLVIGLGVIASLFGLRHFTVVPFVIAHPWLQAVLSTPPALASLWLAVYLFRTYKAAQQKTRAEPASFSLAPYLKVPDYQHTLGSIHHIHDDLLRVLSLVPRVQGNSAPLVIFIDDLDRCSPSKVASVVEGVNMFLASEEYRCVFVIGMDPQMIAAALEDAHAKVRDQLPSFECTVPLGWRFMDKFIQLPFTIPPSDQEQLRSYVDWLATPVGEEVGAPTPTPALVSVSPQIFHLETSGSNEPERLVSDEEGRGASDKQAHGEKLAEDAASKAAHHFKESRDVGEIIREAVINTSGNPREIKRVVNLARLYLGLRNARRAANRVWCSPSLSQYARWITLALRWPDMMRWLQWGADECDWSSDPASRSLQERRLNVLQDEAKDGATPVSWKAAVVKRLNVPDEKTSDWIRDNKLFEFFRAEAERPVEERLSAAVARGFW